MPMPWAPIKIIDINYEKSQKGMSMGFNGIHWIGQYEKKLNITFNSLIARLSSFPISIYHEFNWKMVSIDLFASVIDARGICTKCVLKIKHINAFAHSNILSHAPKRKLSHPYQWMGLKWTLIMECIETTSVNQLHVGLHWFGNGLVFRLTYVGHFKLAWPCGVHYVMPLAIVTAITDSVWLTCLYFVNFQPFGRVWTCWHAVTCDLQSIGNFFIENPNIWDQIWMELQWIKVLWIQIEQVGYDATVFEQRIKRWNTCLILNVASIWMHWFHLSPSANAIIEQRSNSNKLIFT